jgi:hypothetical protein
VSTEAGAPGIDDAVQVLVACAAVLAPVAPLADTVPGGVEAGEPLDVHVQKRARA